MSDTNPSLPSGMESAEEQQLDEDQLKLLFGGEGGTDELSGSGYTYRHDWGDRRGWLRLTLNSGNVTRHTRVFVSVGEGAAGGGKIVGAARYTLHNVGVQDGSITTRIHIDHNDPIRLSVDYLIINP
ncbi:hypothetical protein [Kocuria sp. LHG3120]|uniref:hypothetical protein n=1 Tax=Kocuria sp. LHG3120 TaxID=2804590 RepID=UPI003CE82288